MPRSTSAIRHRGSFEPHNSSPVTCPPCNYPSRSRWNLKVYSVGTIGWKTNYLPCFFCRKIIYCQSFPTRKILVPSCNYKIRIYFKKRISIFVFSEIVLIHSLTTTFSSLCLYDRLIFILFNFLDTFKRNLDLVKIFSDLRIDRFPFVIK